MPPSATDAYNALQAYQMPSSSDVLTQAQNKYGVGDLQTKVANLQSLTGNLTNAIAAVDPSVTGRTAGTLTTEGQRSALVARERAPVVDQLGTANTSLGQEKDLFNTASTNAKDSANLTIADNQAKRQQLLDTYNIANSREEAAKAAAERAAAQQESIRQYNQSRIDANSNAAANRAASGGGKASVGDTKAAVTQHVAQGLAGAVGRDGHVSNETWAAALNDYQAAGLGNVRQFWQQYGRYVNGKFGSSYAGYGQR